MAQLEIKGLQKLSMIDYPGVTATVVFTGGCNFRCPYCQNPELVLRQESQPSITQEEFFGFMRDRKKWVDGVCITGGEPTLCPELPAFVKKIKSMGFKVKLDTNGTNPEMLQQLLKGNLLDYIAMDIKAPLERYDVAAGVKVDTEKIQKSVDLIRSSGVDYEFRTTVLPRIHTKADMIKIGKWLRGSKRYFIQQFRNEKTVDPEFQKASSFSLMQLKEFRDLLKNYFEEVEVRV